MRMVGGGDGDKMVGGDEDGGDEMMGVDEGGGYAEVETATTMITTKKIIDNDDVTNGACGSIEQVGSNARARV